jgi:hypothetical protein
MEPLAGLAMNHFRACGFPKKFSTTSFFSPARYVHSIFFGWEKVHSRFIILAIFGRDCGSSPIADFGGIALGPSYNQQINKSHALKNNKHQIIDLSCLWPGISRAFAS